MCRQFFVGWAPCAHQGVSLFPGLVGRGCPPYEPTRLGVEEPWGRPVDEIRVNGGHIEHQRMPALRKLQPVFHHKRVQRLTKFGRIENFAVLGVFGNHQLLIGGGRCSRIEQRL